MKTVSLLINDVLCVFYLLRRDSNKVIPCSCGKGKISPLHVLL